MSITDLIDTTSATLDPKIPDFLRKSEPQPVGVGWLQIERIENGWLVTDSLSSRHWGFPNVIQLARFLRRVEKGEVR